MLKNQRAENAEHHQYVSQARQYHTECICKFEANLKLHI